MYDAKMQPAYINSIAFYAYFLCMLILHVFHLGSPVLVTWHCLWHQAAVPQYMLASIYGRHEGNTPYLFVTFIFQCLHTGMAKDMLGIAKELVTKGAFWADRG